MRYGTLKQRHVYDSIVAERTVETMSDAESPKYGTGAFPPPREFDKVSRYRIHGHEANRERYVGKADSPLDAHLAPARTVVLLCACVVAVLAIGVALWAGEWMAAGTDVAGAAERPDVASLVQPEAQDGVTKSTPRSEWRRGVFPALFQTDPEWASQRYADGTVATHGCGPTCLSIVYVALTGKDDLDPRDMAEFSELNGFVDGGVTSWLLMSDGANLIGLDSVEVPASAESVEDHLLAGEPIICSVHEGDFTTEGHFIVLAGLNADGTVEIRDPNSEDRTTMSWDLGRVISQCDNIWAFSV